MKAACGAGAGRQPRFPAHEGLRPWSPPRDGASGNTQRGVWEAQGVPCDPFHHPVSSRTQRLAQSLRVKFANLVILTPLGSLVPGEGPGVSPGDSDPTGQKGTALPSRLTSLQITPCSRHKEMKLWK